MRNKCAVNAKQMQKVALVAFYVRNQSSIEIYLFILLFSYISFQRFFSLI